MANEISLHQAIENEIASMHQKSAEDLMVEAQENRKKGQAIHYSFLSTKGISHFWKNTESLQGDIDEIEEEILGVKKEIEKMKKNGWDKEDSGISSDMPDSLEDSLEDILEDSDPSGKTNYEKYSDAKSNLDFLQRKKINLIKSHTDLLNKGGLKETISPTSKNTINFFSLEKNAQTSYRGQAIRSDDNLNKKPKDIPEDIEVDIIE